MALRNQPFQLFKDIWYVVWWTVKVAFRSHKNKDIGHEKTASKKWTLQVEYKHVYCHMDIRTIKLVLLCKIAHLNIVSRHSILVPKRKASSLKLSRLLFHTVGCNGILEICSCSDTNAWYWPTSGTLF